MENLCNIFCGQSNCSSDNSQPCIPSFAFFTHPSSCSSHALIICVDVLLLAMILFNIIHNISVKKAVLPAHYRCFSSVQILVAVFNGCLGLFYIGLGVWILEEKLRNAHSILPAHWWSVFFFQGFTWLLVGLTVSLRRVYHPKIPFCILSTVAFLSAGFFSCLALYAGIVRKEASVKMVLDILSFIGASLLFLYTCKGHRYEVCDNSSESILYTPLNAEASDSSKAHSAVEITPFAKAGLFSRMSFWWLNSLMKLGKDKPLEEADIPKLRDADRAESCYLQFMDRLTKQKLDETSSQTLILWTIFSCYQRDILISGLFALLKILTLSAGPLLLNAFIGVAEGKQGFRYEGFVLAISLFFAKILESLSQRQWFLHSRLIGLKVRSLLTAAIYRKQLKLSNAARMVHSGGEIMNYVTVDAYRIGEFPFWLHQTWTTSLQLCIVLLILIHSIGLATIAALVVIIVTVLCNYPMAKVQHKLQSRLMVAQDKRLKACSEALVNMKVLKLYAWETHFKNVIEKLRTAEYEWLSGVQSTKAYNGFLFWTSPVLVSTATFGACYFLNVPLNASNVFTFVATFRLVQDPIRTIPDVIGVVIQARVAFARILKFLEAPELQTETVRKKSSTSSTNHTILMKSANLSWEMNPSKPTLRNINLDIRPGEKVAICGELGSGKSTLLAAILGEVPYTGGSVQVYGTIAYVPQTAWIQSGTIRENILFGSPLDELRYQETLRRCSLVKDLELAPYGDMTEYIMEALSGKAVLLVTHQVDFLPAFHRCLVSPLQDGEILREGPYHELLASSQEFLDLVNAHKETAGSEGLVEVTMPGRGKYSGKDIKISHVETQLQESSGDQLIKQEEREVGNTGLKPYLLYLNQNKGYFYFSIVALTHLTFVIGQILQNFWMASGVDNPRISESKLILVYLIIGLGSTSFLVVRAFSLVTLSMESSKSLFTRLLNSLFRSPMSFYDSTPLGRILSRVSTKSSVLHDSGTTLLFSFGATTNTYTNLVVLAVVTWPVLFVSIPVLYLAILIQRYYFATAKELMRINGTTKSLVANHLAESVAGAMTIRAFAQENRFFAKNLDLIDTNASPFFHNFAATEWLIQRLETLCAMVLVAAALCMVLLPSGSFSPANYIISVERLDQYMHIPGEAPEIIEDNCTPQNWPSVGKVEICDLQIRYRPGAPLVLRGISCTFEGGNKIGIVGRTGSGKTTLIGALFRLVEPVGGKIVVDHIDICSIGLHDLRSRFGIIPQDPTLFNGTVRFNLNPLAQHTDEEIWEVLGKCQLKDAVQEKEEGLDSLVVEGGSNWSMGQRQLFCLGRALLRRSRVLVLDEATASIDNATDMILQKTIRTEFADCTVITVAHRIPTVMDCTKVLAISDGQLVEYDEPMKLMKKEGSLFGQLVKEYWSHIHSADSR
ncbi:hypothetical protein Cgig2_005071 [Carnegiea gigantea]|uniref:ABC-type xenobiotic transporter n=1 Tax=Carnegiea gigantea TaxID=171969 RepID=A0A9Q1KZF0_9CARY|nr:hypothetical protein Cgig2_005071 [Carnegiea gigantea]